MEFRNYSQPRKYCVDAGGAGIYARIAGRETLLAWSSVRKLSFEQHAFEKALVGYVRVSGEDGTELAWTDQNPALRNVLKEAAFQVPASRDGTIPLLSLGRGLLLTSIVIERAGLVEQPGGAFVRADAVDPVAAPTEQAAVPEHPSPDDVLQQGSAASKRVKQTILLVAGFAAASLLWGVRLAVILLAYLLFHEYGHVVGMKWCGVRVRGIFVLPFLGAVAVSEDTPPTRWKAFVIAWMGPAFGAIITLAAAIALLAAGGKSPTLREIAWYWAVISLFNLLPLGILDGGRIVTSISYSTHRAVGIMASVGTVVLCIAAAIYLQSYLLGVVAFAAFAEMSSGISQRRLAAKLGKMGCDPASIHKALLASWARLGPVHAGEHGPARNAPQARAQIRFLRPFLSGELDAPKMTFPQIMAASGLYLGLLLFFVVVAAFTTGGHR